MCQRIYEQPRSGMIGKHQEDGPLGQVAAHPRLVHVSQGTCRTSNTPSISNNFSNPAPIANYKYTRLLITSQLESSSENLSKNLRE
jgi:hypothetical protein